MLYGSKELEAQMASPFHKYVGQTMAKKTSDVKAPKGKK